MKNLGIARTQVRLINKLPYIDERYFQSNFDIGSVQWSAIKTSPIFYPLLTEEIHDENEGFSALHPSKRMYFIDNFMQDGTGAVAAGAATGSDFKPFITWSPIVDKAKCEGVFNKIITSKTIATPAAPATPTTPPATPAAPSGPVYPDYASTSYVNVTPSDSNWIGPVWRDNNRFQEVSVDDTKVINDFYTIAGIPATATAPAPPASTATNPIPNTHYVFQEKALDGMWWGIESNPFLKTDNTPFWVRIHKSFPPTSSEHATYIVIRIGKNDDENKFDIVLSANQRPRLVDYMLPPSGTTTIVTAATNDGCHIEFGDESARTLADVDRLDVGVMTVAGRLVIYVNGTPFVYTRIDKSATGGISLLECKIAKGPVQIYGTNLQALINLSPMNFSPLSTFCAPIPREIFSNVSSGATTPPGGATTTSANFTGVKWDGTTAPDISVCQIPTPPTIGTQEYGCDCKTFYDMGGISVNPVGLGFHQQGYIYFRKKPIGSTSLFTNYPSIDFYYVVMQPIDLEINMPTGASVSTYLIPFAGCPFFFRLKGTVIPSPTLGALYTDVSDYIISIEETATASDYFHIKKSATVTLYNPNGVITAPTSGGLLPITQSQRGIDISWAWQERSDAVSLVKTFTGVITNVTTNEVAGKETVTLACEDYMYVLKNVIIVNSPFYDGMVLFYALRELASRVGLPNWAVIDDWGADVNNYFLPAGFSFSKPAMRFGSKQKIFECMIDMIQRAEAFMFFDPDGKLHVSHLPGGLFTVPPATPPPTAFVTDPTGTDVSKIILGERTFDFNFDSTVSNISCLTLDRSTKNIIIYAKSAFITPSGSAVRFRKNALLDQPALGELEAAKAWVELLSNRLFKTIIKTRFKTVGVTSVLKPLDFITVDGQSFRLVSIKRSYSADNNDFTSAYEAEWCGG